MALVLDVHLPRRIDFTDLSAPQFSEYGLASRAARLGLNVIYLCLKEGLRPEELRADCVLYNLKSLLEAAGGFGGGAALFVEPKTGILVTSKAADAQPCGAGYYSNTLAATRKNAPSSKTYPIMIYT